MQNSPSKSLIINPFTGLAAGGRATQPVSDDLFDGAPPPTTRAALRRSLREGNAKLREENRGLRKMLATGGKIVGALNREREKLREVELAIEASPAVSPEVQRKLEALWKFRWDMAEKEGIQL